MTFRPHDSTTLMRPIATDEVASHVVCLSVCLSVTTVSPAETSEPIKMPFGMWTRVGPTRKGQFCGRKGAGQRHSGTCPTVEILKVA